MDLLTVYASMLRAFFPSAARLAPWAWPLVALAVLMFGAAYGLAHVIRRRRFYRRNVAGIEEFRSYSHKLAVGLQETAIALVGTALMLASFFVFGAALVAFAHG